MKTFADIREALNRHPSGKMVYKGKIDGVSVMIHKESSGFVVYIDGDRLDSYKSEKEAKDMAQQFVDQYKG